MEGTRKSETRVKKRTDLKKDFIITSRISSIDVDDVLIKPAVGIGDIPSACRA